MSYRGERARPRTDEEQQGGANAAAAGHAAGAPAFESEFDRLARIGN